jgi:hypothetical protein
LSTNYSNTDTLLEFAVKILNFEYFYPQRTTFETIRSSGGLNIISDFQTRTKIIRLYNLYERPVLFDEMHKKYTDAYSIPYFLNNTDLRNISKTKHEFYYNKKFSNIVLGYLNIVRQKITALREVKSECEKLIKNINQNLESKF